LLFLACVGVSAGAELGPVLDNHGLALLGLGALVTATTNALVLGLLYFAARANQAETLGGCSGAQTQPATLDAAYQLSGRSEATYVAYAMVYPAAMIAKILAAQLLALLA
jgi:putative transport protein